VSVPVIDAEAAAIAPLKFTDVAEMAPELMEILLKPLVPPEFLA